MQTGFCREGQDIRIAKIIENFKWEEPCVSGDKGALAIFFSGCNLRCQFCQNYEISHIGKGQSYSVSEFARLLESYNLNNYESIDLVTPSHFSMQIIQAMKLVKPKVKVVWNSNGYESEEVIKLIAPHVDIFLVDLKFYDPNLSLRVAGAKDYFEVAGKAIKLMSSLKPNKFEEGKLVSGVLIRHLILPGQVKDSIKLLNFIKENFKQPCVSIMSQFTPTGRGEFSRKITPLELKTVLAHAERIGLDNGYFQDITSASDCFIPKF